MENLKNFNFWKNKKILIIGHTGFKGSWLSKILSMLKAKVYGCSLKTKYKNDFFSKIEIFKIIEKNFFVDIRNKKELEKVIKKVKPSIIFHFAAQSLVIESIKNPYSTFDTNIIGTLNLLEILKNNKNLKSLIISTSDKCYENKNIKKKSFKENDKLGGDDPYSASKAMKEILINSYQKSQFQKKIIATVRAGNVIGGGDRNKHRIVPDIFSSVERNKKIIIRNPNHYRPWQFVLDPLYGYMLLAKKIYQNNVNYVGAYNFGPKKNGIIKVKDLLNKIKNISKFKNKIKLINKNKFNEKKVINLSYFKAKKSLKWSPVFDINKTVKYTSDWYTSYNNKQKVIEITEFQINSYLRNISAKKLF